MAIIKKNKTDGDIKTHKNRFAGSGEKKTAEKDISDKNKSGKTKKNIPVRLGVLAVILALVAVSISMILRVKPVPPEGVSEVAEKYQTPSYLKGKTMNILVCGIDADSQLEGSEERLVSMTDVIMLINFDREANKATILQIPRDTYVGDIVPYGKINGLYQWGITDDKPSENEPAIGIEPLIQIINEQFALTVDDYVLITMEGFRNAVDLIGGVDIVLDKNDEPIDFEGHFVIKPGVNHLNGELAEVFVRYRNYERADIDRLRMQERFMEALMRKLFELSSSEMISTTWKIRDQLVSTLDISSMIALLKEVKQLSMDDIKVIRVPGEPVSNYGLYGVSVFSVHKKQLADLLNLYMRPYQEDIQEAMLGAIEIQHTRDDFVDEASTLG